MACNSTLIANTLTSLEARSKISTPIPTETGKSLKQRASGI